MLGFIQLSLAIPLSVVYHPKANIWYTPRPICNNWRLSLQPFCGYDHEHRHWKWVIMWPWPRLFLGRFVNWELGLDI